MGYPNFRTPVMLISECIYWHSWESRVVFTAIVLYIITYALPSFAGQLSIGDEARLDSLFRKAFWCRFCCRTFSIDELISAADKKIISQDVSR